VIEFIHMASGRNGALYLFSRCGSRLSEWLVGLLMLYIEYNECVNAYTKHSLAAMFGPAIFFIMFHVSSCLQNKGYLFAAMHIMACIELSTCEKLS
jgi:hypothetical protein